MGGAVGHPDSGWPAVPCAGSLVWGRDRLRSSVTTVGGRQEGAGGNREVGLHFNGMRLTCRNMLLGWGSRAVLSAVSVL